MKKHRLESYDLKGKKIFFWTIEGKDGSTITMTLEQFQEMLAEYKKVLDIMAIDIKGRKKYT